MAFWKSDKPKTEAMRAAHKADRRAFFTGMSEAAKAEPGEVVAKGRYAFRKLFDSP